MVVKNVFKTMTLPNNLILICAKIWLVKTSTRIMKHESQTVKSNPDGDVVYVKKLNLGLKFSRWFTKLCMFYKIRLDDNKQ